MESEGIARAGRSDDELRVEIGFTEMEIVAYVGDLKVVGNAHFGVSHRASSRRSSDYIRSFADRRLTLSQARIYRSNGGELLEAAPFMILNLEKVDVMWAREVGEGGTDEPATGPVAPAEPA